MAEYGNAYIIRIMSKRSPRTISSLKRLRRAERKAKLIDAGKLDSDDIVVDLFNAEVLMHADNNKAITHYRTLHPTKGFQRRSKRRDIFIEVSNKATMWKIIQHNLSRITKGLFDEVIKFKHKS